MDLGDLNVKEFGKKGDYLIKFEKKEFNKVVNIKSIKENVVNKLGVDVNFRRIENVGPKVSAELLNSGLIAICLALGAMLFYIWIRFEWQFSLGSIVAIFHDVLITIGIFSILSLEVNLSIVAAVLTIVGYSMNDTVVIYDRIRENLSKYSSSTIDDVSNTSINDIITNNNNFCHNFISFRLNFCLRWRNFKRFLISNDYRCNYWNLFINICSFTYIKISKS